jgi:C_GCAxxG_C_C family probable redox protein
MTLETGTFTKTGMKLMTKQEAVQRALSLFDQGYACSQAVLLAFSGQFGMDEEQAKLISSTFGGGMGRLREKCGAVTGGFMVLGLAYGNANPADMETKLAAYQKVRKFNQLFEEIYQTSNCAELLKKYATETGVAQRKHHYIICSQAVGDAAGIIYDMLQEQDPQDGLVP